MFRLKSSHLDMLIKLNSFKIRNDDIVFLGLRGCLPVDENDYSFTEELLLDNANINYTNPRCTIIQWRPSEHQAAAFPASTVPHKKYIASSLEKLGQGANQLMTGYYCDYRKGKHKAGSATGHDAFRQTAGRPIRRTADDFDYDNDDRVEFTNPNDNLHAAWCQSINSDSYASAGCQVIVGYPKCKSRGSLAATGAWNIFQKNAYAVNETSFQYILLNGRDAFKVVQLVGKEVDGRLRFGSTGDKVTEMQEALKAREFYEGIIDGDFGKRTLNAVMEFQEKVFGPMEDDGIVGPNTADALDLKLLRFTIEDR